MDQMLVRESTCGYYKSAKTNHVTMTMKGYGEVSLVLPVVSYCLCLCAKRESQITVTIFLLHPYMRW